jgi:hypothetical protein
MRFGNGDASDHRFENLSVCERKFRHKTGKIHEVGELRVQPNSDARRGWLHKGHLKHRFGLSVAQYQKMLLSQNGVCAVCKKPETRMWKGRPSNLAVDHCHETGAVRGLLCYLCNSGIGSLGDNAERIEAAATYLRMHAARENGSFHIVPNFDADDASIVGIGSAQ